MKCLLGQRKFGVWFDVESTSGQLKSGAGIQSRLDDLCTLLHHLYQSLIIGDFLTFVVISGLL